MKRHSAVRALVPRGCLVALLGSLALLGSCAPAPRTQVMVVVTADAEVRAATARLRVRVLGGGGLSEERLVQELGTDVTPVRFPLSIALVPVGNDPSRTYRVEVTALAADASEIVTARVVSGFVSRRTLRLELPLEGCCRGVTCTAGAVCRGCRCQPEDVDVRTLGDLDDDAGAPDAWSPPADAWAPDAVVPPDAPRCVDNCFVLDGFTGGLNIAPPLGDRRWARPLGACPAASLSGSDQHGVRGIYLHNAGPAPRSVRLTTLREPPPDPAVDLALVVYDVPSSMAGTPLPADPRACRAMNDDGPSNAPDAALDVTVAPGATVLVLVTRQTPDQIVSPNVNIGVMPL